MAKKNGKKQPSKRNPIARVVTAIAPKVIQDKRKKIKNKILVRESRKLDE